MTACNDLCPECGEIEYTQPIFNWEIKVNVGGIKVLHNTFTTPYNQLYMADVCVCESCWKTVKQEDNDYHNKNRLEEKAKLAHDLWSHWMLHFLKRYEDGYLLHVFVTDIDRWRRQMSTDYKDLTEKEKESDREVARKYLL